MKKFLALVMAMMMVLAMGTAFAENGYESLIGVNPKFTKTYTVNNGTAPAETFNFNFAFESYTAPKGEEGNYIVSAEKQNIPAITAVSAAFDALTEKTSKEVTIGITANDFPYVGKYVYTMTEADGATEGVTYSTTPLKLVVTVLHDANNANQYVAVVHMETLTGSKTATLENVYDAGQLTVGKEITGNAADMSKTFAFEVVFAAGDGDVIRSTIGIASNANVNVTQDTTNPLKYTFELGDGQTVTFSNLPAGTTYTVTENAENYTSDGGNWSDNTKVISANDQDTVTFTNDLTTGVDTGFNMDNAPYMMIMALVVLAGVAMMMKRRAYND